MKTLVIIGLLALASTAYAGMPLNSLSAVNDGSNVTISWISTDEAGVRGISIERRAGTVNDFIQITTISPKGSNSAYSYIDRSAFKTTGQTYYYRVKIDYVSAPTFYSELISATLNNVSSVKRTWGSLKAMFR